MLLQPEGQHFWRVVSHSASERQLMLGSKTQIPTELSSGQVPTTEKQYKNVLQYHVRAIKKRNMWYFVCKSDLNYFVIKICNYSN